MESSPTTATAVAASDPLGQDPPVESSTSGATSASKDKSGQILNLEGTTLMPILARDGVAAIGTEDSLNLLNDSTDREQLDVAITTESAAIAEDGTDDPLSVDDDPSLNTIVQQRLPAISLKIIVEPQGKILRKPVLKKKRFFIYLGIFRNYFIISARGLMIFPSYLEQGGVCPWTGVWDALPGHL